MKYKIDCNRENIRTDVKIEEYLTTAIVFLDAKWSYLFPGWRVNVIKNTMFARYDYNDTTLILSMDIKGWVFNGFKNKHDECEIYLTRDYGLDNQEEA